MKNKCIIELDSMQLEVIMATLADRITNLEDFVRFKDDRISEEAAKNAKLLREIADLKADNAKLRNLALNGVHEIDRIVTAIGDEVIDNE